MDDRRTLGDPIGARARFEQAVARQAAGDFAAAEALYRTVLCERPDNLATLNNLGLVLKRRGASDEAAKVLRRAIALMPQRAETHNNLGNLLQDAGRLAEAVDAYRAAVARRADFAEAHNNLAAALHGLGRYREAHAASARAIAIAPDYAAAHHNLGRALQALGRPVAAEAAYRRAVELAPELVEALVSLGSVVEAEGRVAEAAGLYGEAVRRRPEAAEGHDNLGGALKALGRLEDAATAYEAACRLAPERAETHCNLGIVRHIQGRADDAIAAYDRAVARRPDYAKAHWNRAVALLLAGRMAEGWAEYEWRFRYEGYCESRPRRHGHSDRWDGSPLEGRTLLVEAEQGLGDTIQFVRYLRLAAARGGRVVLRCQAPLRRLLGSVAGADEVVGERDIVPAADRQVALMSLPRLFDTTLQTVPAAVPYLRAEPALVAEWAARLGRPDGYRVGICWQGSRRNPADARRSLPAEALLRLARLPGVRLVSLQKGEAAAELARLAPDPPVLDLTAEMDETTGAFVDTAAVMANLDLVITVDTATAHLAGALGRPVWTLLCQGSDWRWMQAREDSPWYPSMRLFRQPAAGNWDAVLDRVAAALTAAMAAGRRSRLDATSCSPASGTR